MDQPKYKRVLLKISGEALAGDKHFGLDFGVMGRVADVIRECTAMGVQMGIVIGGGNFWRGVKNGEGYIERSRADHMGMLATAMNCMAMADVLEQKGVDVRVMTSLEIRAVAEPYIRARAIRHLEKGRVVIFGCGTGNPPGGGSGRGCDFARQEYRRRLRLRSCQEPQRREVRRHHL